MLQPKQLFCLKDSYKNLHFILLNLSFSSSRGASAKTAVMLKKTATNTSISYYSTLFLFLITWCLNQNSCFALKNSYRYLNFILLNLFPFPHHVVLQSKQLFCLKDSYKNLYFILLNLSFSSSRGASAKTAVVRG
jgi:hypothetical protein